MITLKPQVQTKQKIHNKDRKLSASKSHYNYNPKLYEINYNSSQIPSNNTSSNTANKNTKQKLFQQKLGVTRAKDPIGAIGEQNVEISENQVVEDVAKLSLSLDRKNSNRSMTDLKKSIVSSNKANIKKDKQKQGIRFPPIQKIINPQDILNTKKVEIFYQSKIERGFRLKQNTYMMNLARQHFLQSIQAIKIGKVLKLQQPKQILNLPKKNPKFKTIYLDLDETLIHCDQSSNNYTIKLTFPVQSGGTIQAGIRVRPYCNQFLQQLSSFAQIIIFTASAPSYADVVLDYLDPKKKYFAHRLYRQHCTLQKGFYTKDLRIVNRRIQDICIVDNSAFSFMTQPQLGVPILPFYHFNKDKQLNLLLKFLRQLVEQPDMRTKIRKTFFWEKYTKGDQDPRKIFNQYFNQI